MNRKRILGITALLAVIAMGLTLTACPPDNEVRSVTFINNLKIKVTLDIQGGPHVELPGLVSQTDDGSRETVTKKGEDVVIIGIEFGNTVVDNKPDEYVILGGTLVAGEQKGKAKKGVALAGGTLIFNPDTVNDTAHLVSFKIGSTLGDE